VPLRHDLSNVFPWRIGALRDVAEKMPQGWLDAYDSDGSRPAPSCTPVEALDRLETVAGVVRLAHLELVPGFRRPIFEVVSEGVSMFTPGEPLLQHSSVIYVANSGSGAPMHLDLHHNLFFHLTGTKYFRIGQMRDERMQHEAVVRKLGGVSEPLRVLDQVTELELNPGDALYVPPFTFHAVESDGPTVSVSCSWSTPSSERAVPLQRVNGRLSRFGVRTAPPGRHRLVDLAKVTLERASHLVR